MSNVAFFLLKKAGVCATLLVTLSLLMPIQAQETPPLTNYAPGLYQGHNQNWAVTQGSDQMIYAANSDGLLEFDGAAWKLYPLPDGQIIRSILCDDAVISTSGNGTRQTEQRIYAGGFSEFGYWARNSSGTLIYHSLSKGAKFKSLKTEEIWHIVKTPKYIYFQSFASIYRYDGKNLTEITTTGNFMFLRFVNNRLLIQLIGKQLYELKGKKFIPIAGTEQLSQTIVSTILPFSDGKLLITTSKHGLFILNRNTLTPWRIPITTELQRNVLNQAILLRDSSYALGTISKGIYIISRHGNLVYQFNKDNGLQNNTVLSLGLDHRDNLWTGLDQGISLIKISSPVISYQTGDNPLGSTYAAAIWRGNLYVGSNNGVFVKKWNSTEPFRPIPGLGGQTWSLRVLNDQLICGHNDATFRITENGAVKISDATGGWTILPVSAGKDSVLLQGAYTGLHIYKKSADGLWKYASPVKGAKPLPIRQILPDPDGSYWLAHAYRGLYHARFTPAMDSVISWKEYHAPGDLPSEYNLELTSWHNKIYLRSGGIFLTPDKNQTFKPATDLPSVSDEAYKLRSGIKGDWFEVFNNRVVYHAPDTHLKVLDLNLIRNSETIIPLSGRYYFFCLDNGYALYDRNHTEASATNNLQPLIRRVANLRNLQEAFGIQNGAKLPYDVRSIRITYALPVFGQNILYRYRLVGLSDQWSEWTDQSFIEFTNLTSANYRFEVRSNANDLITTYQFSIEPYWYETTVARIVGIFILGLLLVGLIIYQEKRLGRHRRRLMAEQEEKLRQERLSNERKIMEIQNEKLQSEIKSKSQQISNVAINVVRKNEILEEIRDELKQVKQELGQQLPNSHYQKLLHSIERNVAGKDDWVLFEENFNEVHEEFFTRLRHLCPGISPSELRLAACLRMNLSTKEMAPALGISIRGVEIKRYRLRRKLDLDNEANLVEFMMEV